MSPTPTIDRIFRVSKMNKRKRTDEDMRAIADQAAKMNGVIDLAGARAGKDLEALDVKGFTAVDDPVFQEALARVRDGRSAGFSFAVFDRSGRSWWNHGHLFREAEKIGATILFGDLPGVDYRTEVGRKLMLNEAAAAEAYYHAVKSRGEGTITLMLADGIPNRVPYGYRRNALYKGGEKVDPERPEKALVPHPEQAPIVELIFTLRADGRSWGEIGDELQRRGVPSPTGGKRWTEGTLGSIIVNESYLGTVVFGRKRRNGSTDKPNVRRVENAHPPLISPRLWRDTRSKHIIRRSGTMAAGLAGAVATCGSCGRPLGVHRGSGGKLQYGCRRSSGEGRCPRPVYVKKDVLDGFVDELVREVIRRGKGHYEIESARAIDDARAAWRDAHERAAQTAANEDVLGPHFRERMQVVRAAEDAAKARYDELVAASADSDDTPRTERDWDDLDLARQQRFALRLLARVEVSPAASRSKTAEITARLTPVWR